MTATTPTIPVEYEPRQRGPISLPSLWTLYTLTLRQYRHGKRWMVMAALMLLPAALIIIVRCTAPNVPSLGMEFIFIFMLIPQALLPFVALIYASGMIQDEVEEQTITYLLIRPISKRQLYLVKLLATLTVAVFLATVFTVLSYGAVYIGATNQPPDVPMRCIKAIGVHGLAVIAYCCLFGLISVFTRRTLIVGILYIVIFEGLFANLAFGIRLITVIYYARMIAYRILPFVVSTPDGLYQNFAADAWQLDIRNDPNLLEHPQKSTCLLVLLLGSTIFALLAAWLCSRREFHVKTPEKG
jgi:ABC-2 type transport system permease protein